MNSYRLLEPPRSRRFETDVDDNKIVNYQNNATVPQ